MAESDWFTLNAVAEITSVILIEFNHKVTNLLQVWIKKLLVTKNLVTALYIHVMVS